MTTDERAQKAVEEYLKGTDLPIKKFIIPYQITYRKFDEHLKKTIMAKKKTELLKTLTDGLSLAVDRQECQELYNLILSFDTDRLYPTSKHRFTCQMFKQMAHENLSKVAKKLYLKNFAGAKVFRITFTKGEAAALCYICSIAMELNNTQVPLHILSKYIFLQSHLQ